MINKTKLVVDTNIWDFAFLGYDNLGKADRLKEDCSKVLFTIYRRKNTVLAVDYKDGTSFILSEYRHKLSGIRDFEVFLSGLWARMKVLYIEPVPDGDHDKRLYSLGFHEAQDHVFVNTALAADRVIITEDGDYGVHGEPEKEDVHTYITEGLGMQLFHASDFCDAFT